MTKFIAIAIKHLIEHGADPVRILKFVEEVADSGGGELPRTPKTSTERVRAYREREKVAPSETVKRVSVSEAGYIERDNTNSKLDNKNNKQSLPNTTKAKRPHRLPDDWDPSPKLLDWARLKGFPPEFLTYETERLKNWASARGASRADWDATWRNWLLKAWEDRGKGTGPPPQKSTARQGFDRAFGRIRAHAAATSNQEATNVVDLSEVRRGGEGFPDPPCDIEPSNGRG